VGTTDEDPSSYEHAARVRYTYAFSRYAGFRAGYGQRYSRYGLEVDRPVRSHEVDVGVDGGYGRSYALARRTTFSFNTGSTIFVRETAQSGSPDEEFDPETRLRLNGSADLVQGWARTWSARLGYTRGVEYEPGVRDPVLSDSASASVGGLLAPRVDFSAAASYRIGTVGFGDGENGFGAASATMSLRAAITANLAAYAQYFYYWYEFERDVALPTYIRRGLERQGVTVGLTVWTPLIGRRGRP